MANITNKQVTLLIQDQTGHTDLALALEEAIERIVAERLDSGTPRWPMVNGKLFQFSAQSRTDAVALLEDTIRLRELLDSSDEPVVVLTDTLAGGCQ